MSSTFVNKHCKKKLKTLQKKTKNIAMMVFIFRIDTKEGLRPNLGGESTSEGVLIKSVPLVTQDINFVIFWKGGEKRTHGLTF